MMTPANSREFLQAVQQEFNAQYKNLRIEFFRDKDRRSPGRIRADDTTTPPVLNPQARHFLTHSIAVCDDMRVDELETSLQRQFKFPAKILRKSGNIWLETNMTRHWTLRQQNDRGLAIGLLLRN